MALRLGRKNGDFILSIPFPHFNVVKKGNKFEVEFPPQKGKRKVDLMLLLSTKSRRRRGSWQGSAGTDAEVRRLMSGEYRTSWIEIMPGRTLRDKKEWFVHITYEFEPEV